MKQAERLIREYYRCFNEREFDRVSILLHDRAELHHVPLDRRLVGGDGYRAFTRAWIAAFPDAHVEVVSIAPFGERGVQVELIGRGTHLGPFDLGRLGTLQPTGRPFCTQFRHVFAIENGKIVESWLDFDAADFVSRLRPDRQESA
jgi:predicted ester cyclase